MSLAEHARRELELCGQYAEDPAYSESIIAAVEAFASYGHSGGSISLAREQLHALLAYRALSPLTSDPAEWADQSEASGVPLWQNRRDPGVFSEDGGQTWHGLEEAASPERPAYGKVPHDDGGATQLWMITCDEGWRSSVVCERVYEWTADWLLDVLGRRPYAAVGRQPVTVTGQRLRGGVPGGDDLPGAGLREGVRGEAGEREVPRQGVLGAGQPGGEARDADPGDAGTAQAARSEGPVLPGEVHPR